MDLKKYFEKTEGLGVLATADSGGSVDVAVYSRPHVMDDGTIAFIMRDRLTHANLQSNPNAAFLFKEGNGKYVGKRLFLTKVKEEKNGELIDKLRRKTYPDSKDEDAFLVYFTVDKVLPLVGPGEE